ncbi:MAG TPA: hypothetical protein VHL09_09835 [Dehalococcoidia bacterium]|nr:hypothetical protein [Dehalococcoidia bacterium]
MSKLIALYRAGRRAVGIEAAVVRPAARPVSRVAFTQPHSVYFGDGVLCDALR